MNQHRLDIQGLRGIAVLLVVLYHAGGIVGGGFIGVDVFFVISGYVIASSLKRQLEQDGSIRLLEFYRRRIRRLLPALALTTVVTLAASFFISPFAERKLVHQAATAATTFRANLFFANNGGGYFDSADEINPLLHTWSLSVEEQFYFVLPVALLALWMLAKGTSKNPNRISAIGLTCVAAASLAYGILLTTDSLDADSIRQAFYTPLPRIWEFLFGVIAALTFKRAPQRKATSLGLWVLGLGAVVASAAFIGSGSTFPGATALPAVVGTTLLLLPSTSHQGTRALSHPALTWIGDRSYSWYLWHWPAIVFTGLLWPDQTYLLLIAAAGSLIIAATTYRWIEQPVQHAAVFDGSRTIALAAACIILPLGAAFTYRVLDERAVLPGVASEITARSIANTDSCNGRDVEPNWDALACEWPSESGRTVFLLGDSHAASIANSVRDGAADRGLGTAVWTRNACPFGSLPSPELDHCGAWQAEALARVLEQEPDVVVISNRGSVRIPRQPGGKFSPLESPDGSLTDDPETAKVIWETSLRGVLDPLDEAGIPVILILNGASFNSSPLESISALRPNGTNEEVTLDAIQRRRGAIVELERRIAEEYDNVLVIDPVEYLCTDTCQQRGHDGWLYFDDDHLSLVGAQRLPFEAIIATID